MEILIYIFVTVITLANKGICTEWFLISAITIICASCNSIHSRKIQYLYELLEERED